jgi:hypothetical protein
MSKKRGYRNSAANSMLAKVLAEDPEVQQGNSEE